MDDAELPARVERQQQDGIIDLPDFFREEFPNLARFLEEELINKKE